MAKKAAAAAVVKKAAAPEGPISKIGVAYLDNEARKVEARQNVIARKVESRERAAADKMIAAMDRTAQLGIKRVEEANEVISALDRPFYRSYRRTKRGDVTIELSVMSALMLNAIAAKWWAHMANPPVPYGETDKRLAANFYTDFMDIARRSEEANFIKKMGDFIMETEKPFEGTGPAGKPAPRGLGRDFLDWIGWPKG